MKAEARARIRALARVPGALWLVPSHRPNQSIQLLGLSLVRGGSGCLMGDGSLLPGSAGLVAAGLAGGSFYRPLSRGSCLGLPSPLLGHDVPLLFENSRNRRGQVGLEKSEFLPTNHRRTNSDGVQCSSRSFPIKQLRGSEILLYPPVLKDDGGVLYAFAHLLSRALVSQSV